MSYVLTLPGGQIKQYTRLHDATARADKVAETEMVELDVVSDEEGTVVYVATPVRGTRFRPWGRVETPRDGAPYFEGFRPAYSRRRIKTTVYRALDKSGWRVYDGRTGKFRDVKGTKEASMLTARMGKGELL